MTDPPASPHGSPAPFPDPSCSPLSAPPVPSSTVRPSLGGRCLLAGVGFLLSVSGVAPTTFRARSSDAAPTTLRLPGIFYPGVGAFRPGAHASPELFGFPPVPHASAQRFGFGSGDSFLDLMASVSSRDALLNPRPLLDEDPGLNERPMNCSNSPRVGVWDSSVEGDSDDDEEGDDEFSDEEYALSDGDGNFTGDEHSSDIYLNKEILVGYSSGRDVAVTRQSLKARLLQYIIVIPSARCHMVPLFHFDWLDSV